MAGLPKDTLYNIFSRIPIKSLARFRGVCKQWCEYIDDPHLANIHHAKEEPKPIHIAPIRKRKSTEPLQQPESVLSFLRIISENTRVGIRVEVIKRSSIIGQEYHQIQGYCNGLIALVQGNESQDLGTTFVVINPLSKERHELPPMMELYRIGQGLGFDHFTNTFKMVCVFLKKQVFTGVYIGTVLVHVLGTYSWREIPQVPFYRILDGKTVYANGRLYWFAKTSNCSGSQEEKVVIWLDMKTEEFGVIDLPTNQTEVLYTNKLADINGEVGIMYRIKGSCDRVVWILNNEEWKIHCVFKPDYRGDWVVRGLWNKDGDLLMAATQGSGLSFYVYRLKSGSFDRLIGSEDLREKQAEVSMYQGSLLSIRKWH